MAVQPWEIEERETRRARPKLRLVPAPPAAGTPPAGRPVAALLFVVLLAGALGFPAAHAALDEPPAPARWSHRPLPGSLVATLDPLRPISGGDRPTSSEPAGGIAFVRCTRLWTALPDGSHARKLLELPGIAAPAFSPDARTIAFIGPAEDGQGIYMIGADGSELTFVGAITSGGVAPNARAMNLTWAPSGRKLAFALFDPSVDVWSGGSSVWSLDVETGEIERLASAAPAPFFVGDQVAYARWNDGGTSFWSRRRADGGEHAQRRMNTSWMDLTAALVPERFSNAWTFKRGVVVLRRAAEDELQLVVKANRWERKIKAIHTAPRGYVLSARSRVAIAQDTSRVLVDLVDRDGGSSLGLLDLRTGRWNVLPYAWDGAATPAPTASGPVGGPRAAGLAGDVLGAWRRGGSWAAALLAPDRDRDLFGMRRFSYIVGTPVRSGDGWQVPATVYGKDGGRHLFRRAVVGIRRTDDGRLTADVGAPSAPQPIASIDDAVAFAAEALGDEIAFAWPTNLPLGTTLNARWPVDGYSWEGSTVMSIHMLVPSPDGDGTDPLSISFGDVSFNLGCGGENDPEEGEVAGAAALFDHVAFDYRERGERVRQRTDQVLWPATLEARDRALYSIYGDVSKATVAALAANMQAQLAAGQP